MLKAYEKTAIQDLQYIKKTYGVDPESAHARADTVLCRLLRAIGYGPVVDEYEKIEKWYA